MAEEDRSIHEQVSKKRCIDPVQVRRRCLLSDVCRADLPDEILLEIFRRVGHKELCRLSRACRRFRDVANDVGVWKRLYRRRYEYDLPLFNPRPGVFEFQQPKESGLANPWKESFRQLYRGIHVYSLEDQPGDRAPSRYHSSVGPIFHCVALAVTYAQQSGGIPFIFVHPGEYREGGISITSDVAVIGAGSGNFAEKVILAFSGSLSFKGIGNNAYLGYLSLRRRVCYIQTWGPVIVMQDLVRPTIENCFISGPKQLEMWNGVGVLVVDGSDPIIRRCHVSHCEQGICVSAAKGSYEDNVISENTYGILSRERCHVVIQRNKISNQVKGGMLIGGYGIVAHNDVHNNLSNIVVANRGPESLIIRGNNIYGGLVGLRVSAGIHYIIEENTFSRNSQDLIVEPTSEDLKNIVVRRNIFSGSKSSLLINPISIVETGENQFLNQDQ